MTKEELQSALVKAHQAGNVDHARVLAKELKDFDKNLNKSYAQSLWSGVKALPQGMFQLGANVGDWLYEKQEGLDEGIELTDPVKRVLVERGQAVPEQYKHTGFGDVVNAEMARQYAEKEAARSRVGREGWDVPETVGYFASPGGMSKVGGKVVDSLVQRGLSKTPQFIQSTAKIAAPVAQGAKAGALYGASMPVTNENYFDTKQSQVGMGAGFGAAVPVAMAPLAAGGKWLGEAAKPFLGKWGRNKDIDKFIRENFRGATEAERAHLHKALQQALPDETAGQAIARYNRGLRKAGIPDVVGGSVISTEKALAKTHEGGSSQLMSKPIQQQLEREQIVDAIARTPWERKVAEGVRKQISDKNYADAFKQAIKADPELARIAQNPFFKKQVKDAVELMKANSDDPKNLTKFLHNIKIGIDKKLSIKSGAEGALDEAQRATTLNLKKQILKWLENKNPAYKKARTENISNWTPINRMDVGRSVKEALINASDEEAATVFQNALRNAPRTIKKATGESVYDDLGQILPKEQDAALRMVSESLKNQKMYNKMATGSENLLKNLSTEATQLLPALLSRPAVITNHILKGVGRDLGPEYRMLLSEKMSNPDTLRKIIEAGDPQTKEMVTKVVNYMASTQGPKYMENE